ncbi:MAG TPA: hypothetical protein VL051_16400 [Burkholderiaceae bacterium]|nr:hypothetical protein [Burkholderiaceae bacterium]
MNPIPSIRPGRPTLRAVGAVLLVLWLVSTPESGHAAGLYIDGLRTTEPLLAKNVQPRLDGQRLLLPLPDGRTIRIQPWLAPLPQHFEPQQVQGESRLLPAGPVSRIEFTRSGEPQAWLVMARGSRPGSELPGGWQLQLKQKQWWVVRAERRLVLNAVPGTGTSTDVAADSVHAQPTRLTIEGADWCLYLLDARVPEPHAAALREQEPQADWVLLRQANCRKSCTPANATPEAGRSAQHEHPADQ